MARMARVVAPGYSHHITQRHHVRIWGYCLMPSHVHLIAVPESEEGLALAIGEAHRRYTRMVNFREGWRGHLWQGRFASFAMDEKYLLACARYIELNPVRAGLAAKPQDWQWSSVHHHLRGTVDPLVKEDCLPKMAGIPWSEFLSVDTDHKDQALFQKHERTGRPCGDSLFVDQLENLLGRKLKPQKPGPKVKN